MAENSLQTLVKEAAMEAAERVLADHKGLDSAKEDTALRPRIRESLTSRGFLVSPGEVALPTSVRTHAFDFTWERDGVRGALELKLKAKGAPVDDSRLFFWHDLKWLEAGIEAGSFDVGTAVLLTDLKSLFQEQDAGKHGRALYYSIGHHRAHRCAKNAPDHHFDLRYPPETNKQFPPELFPLTLSGCYDFRDKWETFPQWMAGGKPAHVLVVPVG